MPPELPLTYLELMTVKRNKPVSLEELWDYEASHPVVFASPRALVEARLIATLGRTPFKRRPKQTAKPGLARRVAPKAAHGGRLR